MQQNGGQNPSRLLVACTCAEKSRSCHAACAARGGRFAVLPVMAEEDCAKLREPAGISRVLLRKSSLAPELQTAGRSAVRIAYGGVPRRAPKPETIARLLLRKPDAARVRAAHGGRFAVRPQVAVSHCPELRIPETTACRRKTSIPLKKATPSRRRRGFLFGAVLPEARVPIKLRLRASAAHRAIRRKGCSRDEVREIVGKAALLRMWRFCQTRASPAKFMRSALRKTVRPFSAHAVSACPLMRGPAKL